MARTPDLFAASALILLGFALFARSISPALAGISTSWRGTIYVFPPSSIFIALATMLCFFATVYSLWMLPFNRTLSLFHFWLTSTGIAVFVSAFYLSTANLSGSRTALWTVLVSPAAVLVIQVLFVWNFVQAILRMLRSHS
jgi:hypothetical protein